MWNSVKGRLPKMGLGGQKAELLCVAVWRPSQEEASISGPSKGRCTLCLLQEISYPRTSGLPGCPVLKNLPANAGDTGLIPRLGKILHVAEQLSPHAPTTEAWAAQSLCSATREATAMRSLHTSMKSRPCSLQPEKARARQQGPGQPKIK